MIKAMGFTFTCLVLIGCATSSIPSTSAVPADVNRIYWSDTTEESFLVEITRDRGQMGSLCMTRIAINGENAADIGQGETVKLRVPTGSHRLSAWQIPGSQICSDMPQRQEANISGFEGQYLKYRYSYSGSGKPSLSVLSGH